MLSLDFSYKLLRGVHHLSHSMKFDVSKTKYNKDYLLYKKIVQKSIIMPKWFEKTEGKLFFNNFFS